MLWLKRTASEVKLVYVSKTVISLSLTPQDQQRTWNIKQPDIFGKEESNAKKLIQRSLTVKKSTKEPIIWRRIEYSRVNLW